jgi:uncharacterized damage-inducible protein DinB
MTIAELIDSYDYNRWANHRTLDAAAEVGENEYNLEVGGSFPTLRATLEHLLAVEVVWLSRWQGHSLGEPPEYSGCRNAEALRTIWKSFWWRQSAFLNDLTDDDLVKPVMIRTRNGIEAVQPLRDTLVHVVHHSAYHRGQAASQIRQLGGKPVATDYFIYCLSRDTGEPETPVSQ